MQGKVLRFPEDSYGPSLWGNFLKPLAFRISAEMLTVPICLVPWRPMVLLSIWYVWAQEFLLGVPNGGGGSCLLRCTIWHIPFRSGHLPEPTVVGPAGFLPFSIVSPLVHFVSASFLLHNIISSRRLELGEVKKGRVYRKKGSLHTKHVSH